MILRFRYNGNLNNYIELTLHIIILKDLFDFSDLLPTEIVNLDVAPEIRWAHIVTARKTGV